MRYGYGRFWARGAGGGGRDKKINAKLEPSHARWCAVQWQVHLSAFPCEKLRVEIVERESNNAEVTTRHTLKIRAFLT